MRPAATWILIDSTGKILLLQRSNYNNVFPYYWTFPAGRWESGEKPEEIIIREVLEETWLQFEPTKLLYECDAVNGTQKVRDHVFLWNYSWEVKIQEEEVEQYNWFTYEQAKNLQIAFHYGEILDKLHKDRIL